eukprot:CAMPEP_0116851860 /NCGR_PEP_ID=MMETSP0418-20121206/16967_1 /TAXON_ID=1158023 /ORGANISM="Astrosyne radiata, Strain 13vi08-1A" /LENGTH=360 /DNA_ID=CAMNT_0004483949 /DNA_START=169 /DNA_END=1251 /DNA_ORIENTATION=+
MAFNKMFVVIPLMLAARKLDGEDPFTIYWLRVVYGLVETVILLCVGYTYIQATTVAKRTEGRIVYVPPPPQPFMENTKKKYTETSYGAHIISQARSLLGSTIFGILLTAGLHYYRGMVIGLAMQAVLGPLNLYENVLAKAVLFGKGIRPEDHIFEEKVLDELTPDDEVVDESGNPVVRSLREGGGGGGGKTLEDVMLDTWDAGDKANLGPLMQALHKRNVNYKTKENGWTPLMILSGLGAKGSGSAIRQVKQLGGNPAIVDGDGWNAMHWAAFHGSLEAAKVLVEEGRLDLVKDKEGKTPIEHARAEKNQDVAKLLEGLSSSSSSSSSTPATPAPTDAADAQETPVASTKKGEEGLRKRK